jgi:hypothetical protein
MTIPYRVSKADQYNDESHVASRARGHLSRGRRFAYVLLVSISFSYATNHSISSTKIDRCNDGDDVASRAPSRLAFLFLSLQAHHSPIPSRLRCVTLRWTVPDEWHEHAFTLPINTAMKVTSRAGLVVVFESLSPPYTYKPIDFFLNTSKAGMCHTALLDTRTVTRSSLTYLGKFVSPGSMRSCKRAQHQQRGELGIHASGAG